MHSDRDGIAIAQTAELYSDGHSPCLAVLSKVAIEQFDEPHRGWCWLEDKEFGRPYLGEGQTKNGRPGRYSRAQLRLICSEEQLSLRMCIAACWTGMSF